RPEVFPTAAEGILTFRKELVKILQESRVVPVSVENPRMMMVAHRYCKQYVDIIALCRDCQTIDKRLICLSVWAHQELALRTATGDQVRAAWQNLTGT